VTAKNSASNNIHITADEKKVSTRKKAARTGLLTVITMSAESTTQVEKT
jgi:hypothetical protein